jgi:hypothetical protein
MKISNLLLLGLLNLSLLACNQPNSNRSIDDDDPIAQSPSSPISQVEESSIATKDDQAEEKSSTESSSSQVSKSQNPGKTNQNNTRKTSNTKKQPKSGLITEIQQGDILCYVTLKDEKGKQHNLGATFEICEQEDTLLNKPVKLSYSEVSVNDCESIEPCGKSRQEIVISKAVVNNQAKLPSTNPSSDRSKPKKEDQEDNQKTKDNNTSTLSNKKWTITIGNDQSWNGVNGTGNLTYKGCNNQGSCISLKGGKVVSRDGIFRTFWKNGDYTYVVESPITEDPTEGSSTLVVFNKDKEILRETGLK